MVCVFGILQGGMGIGQSGTYIEAINTARASAVQIYRVIARKSLIDSSSTEGIKPAKFEGNIRFVNVCFNYPSRKAVTVLKNFSLEIPRGKTVALVGSSGCGKSTCIQLLQRFYDPDSGSVLIDGNNLQDLNVGWLRDNLGIVGQEPVLFDCSIRENICYAKKDATVEEFRTSKTHFLSSAGVPDMQRVERRVQRLVRVPLNHAEDAQVLRYDEGDRYLAHHDFFDPKDYAGNAHFSGMVEGGARNRLATVFFYLNTPEGGGETNFPRAGRLPTPSSYADCSKGVSVRAEANKVIIFYDLLPNGDMDFYSLHAACPVEAGEKHAANFWVWNIKV